MNSFVMVMIICFGAECEAVFDSSTTFDNYNTCYSTALQTTAYMREMYPQSAGEIHCYNDEQLTEFKESLKNGEKPTLTTPEPTNLLEA
jgi:hypothetical protein|tara:strand:- start:134 stop:400 length:267 start_codon:yes stop_codon:yes gene_type:complete